MAINASNPKELEELQKKVDLAHSWANKHFRTDLVGTTQLIDEKMNIIPRHARLDFPDAGTMIVNLQAMGVDIGVPFTYKLHLPKDGGIYWQARNPLLNNLMPPLVVVESLTTEKIKQQFAPHD